MFTNLLPDSFLQMSAIFLSIIIEALPFVLLGCLASGFLHVFLSPKIVAKVIPKNKFLATIFGAIMGVCFPSCECGIVPIVHRLIQKKVPIPTAFAFMLSAPIINPVVIFSTYIAFGNSWQFVGLRVVGSLIVAILIGLTLTFFTKVPIFKSDFPTESKDNENDQHQSPFKSRFFEALTHSVDEFFDTGRFLIFGALAAASMQTWLPTRVITQAGHSKPVTIAILLILAFTLSLCSEADAFVGSSLLSLFGTAPIVAFLVFGPMVDLKNLLMMNRYFNAKFILKLVLGITIIVFIYALFL